MGSLFLCIGEAGASSRGYICQTYPRDSRHYNIRGYTSCSMKTTPIFLLVLVLTVCYAADEPIPIVSQSQDGPNPDGSYSYSYETGNGIKAQESGSLANAGSENEALQVSGSVSYKGDDGQDIALTYTANEEGFQPQGDHLPTAPPVPPLIAKALEWIAAHPSKEDQKK